MVNVDLDKVRAKAEEYYRNGDFYCSEAVVKVIVEEFGLDVGSEVIKAASGFPVGIGGMGCTCGAISGGVIAIGLVFGRCEAKDERVNKAMELSSKLYNVFVDRHKVSCCKVLTRGMEKGSPEHMEQCIYFTGEVAYETAKIIMEELD